MAKRILRVIFNKRAKNDDSYTTKITLPKKDLNKMGITMEDREVEYEFDEKNNRMIISKTVKQ